jgi:hypothetical protein
MTINTKQIRGLIAIYAVFAVFAKFVIAPYANAEGTQHATPTGAGMSASSLAGP